MNAAPADNIPRQDELAALTDRAGLVELGHRTRIEATGADRASFVHNFCTNEVRKLLPGAGCEAFLTSVQGKTLGHVFIFAGDEALVLDTVPGEAETILQHLNRYLICEHVELADRSGERIELFLGGALAARLLAEVTGTAPPDKRLSHAQVAIGGKRVALGRADLAGPEGFLLSMAEADAAAVRAALWQAGAVACGSNAFEAARIAWGFPLFGRDLTAANLPQELARDAQAISFIKGCYLGQETVARIDALGHVNRTLVGLRLAGADAPLPGTPLLAGGGEVGQITSAEYSPRFGQAIALAFVRRGSNAPGTQVTCGERAAEVVALPMT